MQFSSLAIRHCTFLLGLGNPIHSIAVTVVTLLSWAHTSLGTGEDLLHGGQEHSFYVPAPNHNPLLLREEA